MFQGIKDWVEDKATGYLRTGIQAGGTLAGNAVGGVGSLVEGAGKSAANGVQGGIGGVGSYITGYGNSIKQSMSADGPVSGAQKKTAVKPSAPQKAIGAAQPAKNALPPSTLPKKAPSAPKSLPASKPAARTPPAKSNTTQKPPPNRKPHPNNKPRGPTSVKPQGPVGVTKPTSAAKKPASNAPSLVSKTNSSGKTMVSPESRPGYRKTAVTRGTPNSMPAQGGDILGIGENFGDISKTRGKNSQNNNNNKSSGAARKTSAADPLGMGDLENIGKSKK